MKKIGIVCLVVVALLGGCTLGYYNLLVTSQENISAQWAQIDNQLKRRSDLIPNLVNAVKGFMKHEREIFSYVADARSRLAGAANIQEKISAAKELDGALGRLLMVMENYPALKSNETVNRLMDELAGTENRLSTERMRYNQVVRKYNTSIKRIPGSIFANMFNFGEAVYYEVEEKDKALPKVEI